VYNQKDFDRNLVLEKRTELVARKLTEFLAATGVYSKTIVFCEDIDHAERMRQALVNANPELCANNRKYVMRITGDSDEGNGLTLTKACSPYMVDDIDVNYGGVLTIEAGATLEFSDNTTISVGQSGTGKVLINGTAQNPVTLTTQPSLHLPGGWYGLVFYSGTASGSQVTYTTIDYAGGNFDGAIVVDKALPTGTLTLDHVTINNNDTADGAVPIYMNDGSATIACTSCTADGKPLTH